MTKLVKIASALAIAMTALTAMTALATDASAKINRGSVPTKHHKPFHVSPLIAQALRNHPNLLTQQLGKTSGGGQVISCHPNTGCTIGGGGSNTHHHPYGGWHRHEHEHHHWNWYSYDRHGYRYGHGYPVEVAGSYEGPTCEAPFKWRLRMVRHGFHHVFKKVCVEAL